MKHPTMTFEVGVKVERDIDGLWFPGVVVAVSDDDETCDVQYDEDSKIEEAVPLCELRRFDADRLGNQAPPRSYTSHGHRDESSSLLLQPDYDPNKAPTIVLHNKGEANGGNGYIINGLETNVAAGNGLRGIRWLRVNT
ncbi:hypothetical protein SDRG_10221 [Saprolegnia diclina VS20]|uniref:Agenet-like domain-containing protein n=1 Tax=Saprolegnia diclina (strain VS20) TaxID=1156394 RepID=T0RPW1_SAPDV|nr:hypothetical protein SDRG_10221 [Saprolegnia diclina VS20]EQC32022.1 hypothetical protein SDRG_10221 [Saprolegnia diclina VS20]|eukprot:XP_008614424.1 hypothetical protein SDRG_10221 [Saprolegnia diclina VS20]